MGKLYENELFMWLMLFTITPIGIYLMWKNLIFSKWKRVRATIIFMFLFSAAIIQAFYKFIL